MMFEFLWNYRKNRFAKNAITAEKLKSRRFLLDDFQCCNHIIFSKYRQVLLRVSCTKKQIQEHLSKALAMNASKNAILLIIIIYLYASITLMDAL